MQSHRVVGGLPIGTTFLKSIELFLRKTIFLKVKNLPKRLKKT